MGHRRDQNWLPTTWDNTLIPMSSGPRVEIKPLGLPRKGTRQGKWSTPCFLLAIGVHPKKKKNTWIEYYSAIKKSEFPITDGEVDATGEC